jgi:hypothetical protein
MDNFGRCALCHNEGILKEGHIIPKFTFKWLKKTSITGFFRSGISPNLRLQDGWRTYLLCGNCEELFSKWETLFNNKIFLPFNDDAPLQNFYEDWLIKFAVSISWRVLTFFKINNYLNHFNQDLLISVDNALNDWRNFLLEKTVQDYDFEQHMLPVPPITNNQNLSNLPSNINQYVKRSIDIDVVCSTSEAYTYAKLGHIFIFGFIKKDSSKVWNDTKINNDKGTLLNKHYEVPQEYMDFIFNKAKRMLTDQNKMSEKQWNRIDKDYKSNSELFKGSKMFEAINLDEELFNNSKI